MKPLLILLILVLISCDSETENIISETETEITRDTNWDPCTSTYREDGRIYDVNTQTYLWAGQDSSWHFNITDWELNECNLNYGLGRETFPALLEPQYDDISTIPNKYNDAEQCIVLHTRSEVKIYPYKEMVTYEVINEYVEGRPIMIAYCVLADLGAVYTREYCGEEITFAVSGYTYFEDNIWEGLDGFILWDRDTESLWWPLIDKAISGEMHGTYLEKHDEGNWEVLRWNEIKQKHPNASVLKSGQTQAIPVSWPRIQIDC